MWAVWNPHGSAQQEIKKKCAGNKMAMGCSHSSSTSHGPTKTIWTKDFKVQSATPRLSKQGKVDSKQIFVSTLPLICLLFLFDTEVDTISPKVVFSPVGLFRFEEDAQSLEFLLAHLPLIFTFLHETWWYFTHDVVYSFLAFSVLTEPAKSLAPNVV